MSNAAFRAELVKIMPGYKWTIHKSLRDDTLEATGTQSSGFNRLSTLVVTRQEHDNGATYTTKTAGYGLRAKFLGQQSGQTLAQALRHLQDHYERMELTYRSHVSSLQRGRTESKEHQ